MKRRAILENNAILKNFFAETNEFLNDYKLMLRQSIKDYGKDPALIEKINETKEIFVTLWMEKISKKQNFSSWLKTEQGKKLVEDFKKTFDDVAELKISEVYKRLGLNEFVEEANQVLESCENILKEKIERFSGDALELIQELEEAKTKHEKFFDEVQFGKNSKYGDLIAFPKGKNLFQYYQKSLSQLYELAVITAKLGLTQRGSGIDGSLGVQLVNQQMSAKIPNREFSDSRKVSEEPKKLLKEELLSDVNTTLTEKQKLSQAISETKKSLEKSSIKVFKIKGSRNTDSSETVSLWEICKKGAQLVAEKFKLLMGESANIVDESKDKTHFNESKKNRKAKFQQEVAPIRKIKRVKKRKPQSNSLVVSRRSSTTMFKPVISSDLDIRVIEKQQELERNVAKLEVVSRGIRQIRTGLEKDIKDQSKTLKSLNEGFVELKINQEKLKTRLAESDARFEKAMAESSAEMTAKIAESDARREKRMAESAAKHEKWVAEHEKRMAESAAKHEKWVAEHEKRMAESAAKHEKWVAEHEKFTARLESITQAQDLGPEEQRQLILALLDERLNLGNSQSMSSNQGSNDVKASSSPTNLFHHSETQPQSHKSEVSEIEKNERVLSSPLV